MDSVDFPKFVADLLKAVFDANLKVMKTQTDTYIKLMKEATKSSAEFITRSRTTRPSARLAEKQERQVQRDHGEGGRTGRTSSPSPRPTATRLDLEDAEVKKDILEEKINMAKEHRAALREVLLMGVTRLVVEKGQIEAGRRLQHQGDPDQHRASR